MKRHPHLSRAPIVEALIDFRVELPSAVGIDQLRGLYQEIKEDYPNQQDRHKMGGTLAIEEGKALKFQSGSDKIDAIICRSLDNLNIVQYQLDGFTFSRLKPYETWENLQSEARRLWQVFEQTTKPYKIIRVGTRFINRIQIPAPARDFSDYLTASPQLPPRLEQSLVNFLTRVVMPAPSIDGAFAALTQALEKSEDLKLTEVLLDIDVYQKVDIEHKLESAWNLLEKFRIVKNEIFFESITHRTIERYS